VWFILEFYLTQILISTTSRFECISRLIKVTDNNRHGGNWKLIRIIFKNPVFTLQVSVAKLLKGNYE
jgi:hypothetical protein